MPLKDHLTSIFDVFSRRSSPRGKGFEPDDVSERLRNRILLLYREVFSGRWGGDAWSRRSSDYTSDFWEWMATTLQHLHGRPKLTSAQTRSRGEDAVAFVVQCEPPHFFDFLEQTFRADCLFHVVPDSNELVDALNEIFRVETAPYQLTHQVTREEQGTGRYGSGIRIRIVAWPRVIRVDEEITHSEAIAPALAALNAPDFEAASLEFRDALDEYRRGHYADCLTKCCSAFESVMKILCKRNGWSFDERRDAAAALLSIVIANSTLNPFFKDPILLIATMRNRLSSSHGGGDSVRSVPRHVGQYAITSTAAAIVLLVHEAGG